MGGPEASAVVRLLHTALVAPAELAEARALLDLAFEDFSDHDWPHALGGMHALVRSADGVLAAHGSLVMRRLLVGERSLRCGYVEAVATRPDHRRRGHAAAVMEALESLAPAYDLLALSASAAGAPLYRSRGWLPWRGPTAALAPTGPLRTPGDDGSIYVLPGAARLDLDALLACDWRDGDVW